MIRFRKALLGVLALFLSVSLIGVFKQEWVIQDGRVRGVSETKEALDHFWNKNVNESPLPQYDQDSPSALELEEIDHPISRLIANATIQAWKLRRDQPTSLAAACLDYRNNHGRLPPPRFDKWWQYATERNTSYLHGFEQIAADLRPFWGVEPQTIRQNAQQLKNNPHICQISIRSGKSTLHHENQRGGALSELIQPFVHLLPDMDINVNQLDEPRVVVPYEKIRAAVQKEGASRNVPAKPTWEFSRYKLSSEADDDVEWQSYGGKPFYNIGRRACPPDSPAFLEPLKEDGFDNFEYETKYSQQYSTDYYGFVANMTRAADICNQPDLQGLHGALIGGNSAVISDSIIPVFSECKLSINNDIVFPATMYYRGDDRYDYSEEGDVPWGAKHDTLFWRGVPSGGAIGAGRWKAMQRTRLVDLLNSTKTSSAEIYRGERSMRELNYRPARPSVSKFLDDYTDAGFTELIFCADECEHMASELSMKPQVPMNAQFDNKYLLDVDGQSFSARFRAFQFSKSLSIKSTLYREWHDTRLVPWYHFVPLDTRFQELISILAYFTGFDEQSIWAERHDHRAQAIAAQGRSWAQRTLRKEDMEVYVFLLLLEYARVFDDNRDTLGFVVNP